MRKRPNATKSVSAKKSKRFLMKEFVFLFKVVRLVKRKGGESQTKSMIRGIHFSDRTVGGSG